MFKLFVKNPPQGRDITAIPAISYDYINKKCLLIVDKTVVHLPFNLIKTMYKTIVKSEEMNIT